MKVFIVFIFFLIGWLFGAWVTAQTSYIHYTTKDGLVQMQCHVIYQDSKGYMWFGTKNGLSRFDGINFKNYSWNNGLVSSDILSIVEDKNGTVWFSSSLEISKILGDTIISFKLPTGYFNPMLEKLPNDDIIIQTYAKNEIVIFKLVSGKYVEVPTDNSIGKNGNSHVYYLNVLPFQNYFLVHIYGNNKVKILDTVFETNSHFFKKNMKLYCSSTDLNLKETTVYQYKNLAKTPIRKIKGLNVAIYDLIGDSIYYIQKSSLINNSQYKISVSHLFEETLYEDEFSSILFPSLDNEGNLWLVGDNGIFKVTPFRNYYAKHGMPNYVWSIIEGPDKKIWFASYVDAFLNYFENNKLFKNNNKFFQSLFYMGALKKRSGEILFTTSLNVISLKNNKFSTKFDRYKAAYFYIFEDTITNIVYYGSTVGLIIEDSDGNIRIDEDFVIGKKRFVLSMVKDNDGRIWYGNSKYLGTLNCFPNIEIALGQTSVKRISSIICDFKNNLWLAANNGLFLYNGKKFIRISHPELNELISAACKIGNDKFVYGGARGIGIFDLEAFYSDYSNTTSFDSFHQINATNYINYYDKSSGFLGEEVGQNGILYDSQQRVWIATNNNVVMFKLNELKTNSKPPQVHINIFKASEDNFNWVTIHDSIQQLSYKQTNIEFEFIGISLSAPELVKYKYRLVGQSNEWSNETKNRSVNYTNLSPGKYFFELHACNSNGVWTKEPLIREFRIMHALWQTLLFKIILSLLILFGVIVVVRYFVLWSQRRRETRFLINEMQLKLVRSQLYPHFLFNAFTAIGSLIYHSNPEKAYSYFVKLTKLIREVLDDNKSGYKSLADEINFVKKYLELQQLRFENRFVYRIVLQPNINYNVLIPVMLIQTFVENAIKHGLEPLKFNGILIIKVSFNEGIYNVVIQDNGIGLAAAEKKDTKSLKSGIATLSKICEIHNQSNKYKININIVDLYAMGKIGTRVAIKIDVL